MREGPGRVRQAGRGDRRRRGSGADHPV